MVNTIKKTRRTSLFLCYNYYGDDMNILLGLIIPLHYYI